MTRRKRTPEPALQNPTTTNKRVTFATLPPPSSTSLSSFQIPASLQKLSTLSASLARSVDAPRQFQNSEIVKQAQALVDGSPPTSSSGRAAVGPAARDGVAENPGKTAPNKELKWKTSQKDFPVEQTWVRSIANYTTAGHARALVTKYAAAAAATEEEKGRKRANEAEADAARDEAPTNGVTHYTPIADPRSLDGTNSTPRYHVGMDGRVTLLKPPAANDQLGSAVSNTDTVATADASRQSRKKRKHIEFVEKHQRDFPSQQTWVKPPPPKVRRGDGSSSHAVLEGIVNDRDIEARRRATIASLQNRGWTSPVVTMRSTSVGSSASRSVTPGSMSIGQLQQRQDQPRPASKASNRAPATQNLATALEYSKNQDKIAALIAKKRAENAASGQQQRLLELRLAHQSKVAAQQQGLDSGLQGSPPWVRTGMMVSPSIHTSTSLPSLSTRIVTASQAAVREIDHNVGGENDSDEDAPGEDDEAAAVAPPVRPSVEVGQHQGQQSHLVTDPGDLGSLFSSRHTSPPPQSSQEASSRTDSRNDRSGMGRRGPHGYATTATASGYGKAQQHDALQAEGEPMTPSAQLLMALANATPPPSWDAHPPRQQSGRPRGRR